MIEHLLQGLGIGIGLAIMVGPITLTILDSSLAAGWKAGIVTALAMWLSDGMYIAAGYYGGSELMKQLSFIHMDGWMNVVAGGILLLIGLTLLYVRKHKIDLTAAGPPIGHMAGHALRGFMVNTFSPFTLLFWPTIIMSMVLEPALGKSESIVLFVGIMLPIISGDILKSLFADWIRQRITERYMRITRTIIAIVFIGAGVAMVLKYWYPT